jgi:hypothetical protein
MKKNQGENSACAGAGVTQADHGRMAAIVTLVDTWSN